MATMTPEIRQELEQAGQEPVRIDDPETKLRYLIVREEVYQKMLEALICDHTDRSLYEFGEFYPDPPK